MAIAKTLATAAVGDKVWICDQRYRETSWKLETVAKVARTYLYVQDSYDETGRGFEIATGRGKMVNGFVPRQTAYGSGQRAERAWNAMRSDLAKQIEMCGDATVIRDVAFALGVPEPPDYSIEP